MNRKVAKLIKSIPQDIFERSKHVEFNIGENIIVKGNNVQKAYVLHEGSIDVLNVSHDGVTYIHVRDENPVFIGLMETFSNNDTYCCTCRVTKKSKGIELSIDDVKNWFLESNYAKEFLIEYWASKSYESAMKVGRTSIYSTEALLLDMIIEKATSIQPVSNYITIYLKRTELAEFLGCSLRTIYRQLSKLNNKGLISINNGKIQLTLEQLQLCEKTRKNL